ncbi:hypothetical protein NMY22_g5175 [Coprinellus aureogranulatus]|nr:hypothetical protein NMY22_g5175 [Coprinellus aureogranulatus]
MRASHLSSPSYAIRVKIGRVGARLGLSASKFQQAMSESINLTPRLHPTAAKAPKRGVPQDARSPTRPLGVSLHLVRPETTFPAPVVGHVSSMGEETFAERSWVDDSSFKVEPRFAQWTLVNEHRAVAVIVTHCGEEGTVGILVFLLEAGNRQLLLGATLARGWQTPSLTCAYFTPG